MLVASRAVLRFPLARVSSLQSHQLCWTPACSTTTTPTTSTTVRAHAQSWRSALSYPHGCVRSSSSSSSSTTATTASPAYTPPLPSLAPTPPEPRPPSVMTEEIFRGVQLGTLLYMKHGIGRQRLTELREEANVPLVIKWQRCMEAYLGVQIHVLAGLGYKPDETGIALYNQQLNTYLHQMNTNVVVTPDMIEQVRTNQRDIWRLVLSTAFGIDLSTIVELPIDEARSIMHKVALRMQEDDVLEEIAKRCASIVVPNDNPQLEFVQRHYIVQETLVHKVYLGSSLLEECGFTPTEEGYIRLQLTMADHQNDPLVAQYIGNSMMQIIKVAGLTDDVPGMQQQQEQQQQTSK